MRKSGGRDRHTRRNSEQGHLLYSIVFQGISTAEQTGFGTTKTKAL